MDVVSNKKGRLKKSALRCYYIKAMLKREEISISVGDNVTIVGTTMKGDKYAVQFDHDVFTDEEHSFNSGCHGKGDINRCLYVPIWAIEEKNPVSRRTEILYAIL